MADITKQIGVALPMGLWEDLERFLRSSQYMNLSDLVRELIRVKLKEMEK